MNHELRPAAPPAPGIRYEHAWERTGAPAFATGIPAMVGPAEFRAGGRGAGAGYRVLERREQLDQVFRLPAQSFLGHAVRGFFENGGMRCVVVPVSAGESGPAALAAALIAPLLPGGGLEDLDMIDLVCMPDLMLLAREEALALEVQDAVLAHCRRMQNRFAILDALPDAQAALRQWDALEPGDGALYFPWLRVRAAPPAGRTDVTISVPPCGHVAGVYARTDLRAGPHLAPANELLHQVVGLDLDLGEAEHAALNDKGVNCLRSLPGRGIRIWGARTLSAEPRWRYVNVRRLFLTLARWVEQNCGDLAFEVNDARLWEALAQRVRGYCRALYNAGALAGRSPADAFHVKCDAETNRPATVEAGMVVAEVGLAPVVPAEFIVVRITRHAGGALSAVPPAIA